LWLGYSSQGPGQPGFAVFGPLARDKPDLCAPSQFCETLDAYTTNGGTSAASALAAGVIAALRSNPQWSPSAVPPEKLKTILNASARKTTGSPGWNNRFGNGILDAAAAVQQLQQLPP
jgi:subtilisin family serine protease